MKNYDGIIAGVALFVIGVMGLLAVTSPFWITMWWIRETLTGG